MSRALLFASVLALCSSSFHAQTVPCGYAVDLLIGTGLNDPQGFAFLPDGRMLIIEKTGAVRLWAGGNPALIGTIPDVRGSGSEGGLVSIVADPGFSTNGYAYLWYPHQTASANRLRLIRVRCSGDLNDPSSTNLAIDPGSLRVILDKAEDSLTHHGGHLVFGPGGMLHLSIGDNTNWNQQPLPLATSCRAQVPGEMLGCLLRLDVSALPSGGSSVPPSLASLDPGDNPLASSSDPAERLVIAHGLRNPFRYHIDPSNGDIFIGDVGNLTMEEINRYERTAGGTLPLMNFGWPYFEGFSCPTEWGCDSCGSSASAQLTAPLVEMAHNGSWSCVVVGPRYRTDLSAPHDLGAFFEGALVFGDWSTGNLALLREAAGSWNIEMFGSGFGRLTQISRGPDGALYLTQTGTGGIWGGSSGTLRRIRPSLETSLDQPGGPGTPVTLQMSGLCNGKSYANFVSLDLCPNGAGTGPLAGLCAATAGNLQFLSDQLMLPPSAPPFRFQAAGTTASFGPFALPPMSFEVLSIELTPTGFGGRAPVVRLTVQ